MSKEEDLLFEEIARTLNSEAEEKESSGRSKGAPKTPALKVLSRKDRVLLEEAGFWLSLSPPFNQKDYQDLVLMAAEKRLAEEGLAPSIKRTHAHQAIRLFLHKHRIERTSSGYVVPPHMAISLILERSPEEFSRRLELLEEAPGSSKLKSLAAVLNFFVHGVWPEEYDQKMACRRLEELLIPALEDEKFRRRVIGKNLTPAVEGILRRFLRQGLAFSPARLFPALLEALAEEDPDRDLYFPAALLGLLMGRLEEVRELASQCQKPWQTAFLKALSFYYQRNLHSALESLELALKLYRTDTRKKYPVELGEWGLWVARILSLGGPKEKKQAINYLRKLLSENFYLNYETNLSSYRRYLEKKQEDVSYPEGVPLDLLIYAWFIEEKARYDKDIPDFYLKPLKEAWERYVREGFLFPAAEIARALYACREEKAGEWLREQGLLEVEKEVPRWQNLLEDLRKILAGAPEEENRRLVWLVDPEKLSLTPVEQKRRKDGSWTAGRPVALKRLLQKDFSPLAPEDEKVLAYLTTDFVGYGYWRRRIYYFEPEVFLGLVGHPRVFHAQTREPLEVVEARPEVILRREKEGLRLALRPYVYKGSKSRIQVELEGSRLVVYRVTPRAAYLSDLLEEEGQIFPPEAEKELQGLLGLMAREFQVSSDLTPEEAREVSAEKRLVLILRPVGEGLRLTVRARPLGEEGPGFLPGSPPEKVTARVGEELLACTRDLGEEKENLRRLEELLDEVEGLEPAEKATWRAPDLESALALTEKLEDLPREHYLVLWPGGKPFTVTPSPEALPLRGRSLEDWLEVETPVKISEDQVSLAKVLQHLQEKGSRFVPLTEGRFLALRENLYRRLREVAELAEIKGQKVRLHPLRAFLLARESGLSFKGDKSWEEFRSRLEKALSLNPEIPAGLRTALRAYQEEGFRWLRRLYEAGLGGCLADDMGLGKTLQTLALLLAVADQGPSLVVAPASVVSVWREEARRFTPELTVISLGEVEDRARVLTGVGPGEVVLVSYGLLQREETAELLSKVNWNVVVLDEAQHIKNYRTKRARHALKLRARFRLATTGTPIENRLEELWTLFRFLQPGLLGSLEDFRRRFVIPIERAGDREARRCLRRLVRPFVLRRLKAEVLEELPPRTETVLRLDFSPEEREFYERVRLEGLRRLEESGEDPRARLEVLAVLTRLRQICCSPRLLDPELGLPESKLSALTELVEEIVSGDHRVLVFSQFVSYLRLIEEALSAKGLASLTLEGSLSAARRRKLVERFQRGEVPVFLISLRAGGVGLNLTAADYVVLTDPWWNPAVEEQAADRAHRIGQRRPVTIYRLVIRDTVEERVLELHRQKKRLGQEILSETGTPALSLEELRSLLSS